MIALLSNIKRVVALQPGVTSLLRSPLELHNILRVIRPDVIPKFLQYAQRYCDAKIEKDGVRYGGASFLQELKYLWRTSFAVKVLQSKRFRARKIEIPGAPGLVNKIREQLSHEPQSSFF